MKSIRQNLKSSDFGHFGHFFRIMGVPSAGLKAWGRPARQVLYWGSGLLLVLYVATTLIILETRDGVISDSKRELSTLNAILTEETSRSFDSVRVIVRAVAGQFEQSARVTRMGMANPENEDWVQRVLTSRAHGIAPLARLMVTDPGGNVLAISSGQEVILNVSDTSWFQRLVGDPDMTEVMSSPVKSRISVDYGVVIARKILGPRGEILGVIAGRITLAYFNSLYGTLPLDRNSTVTLWHSNGILLGSSPPLPGVGTLVINPEVFTKVHLSEHVSAVELVAPVFGSKKSAVVLSAQRGRGYPFVLAVSRSRDTVLAGWFTSSVVMIIANVVITVLAVLFIWALIRSFVGYEAVTKADAERERAETDRKHFEDQLRQSQKLEMVGQLTTGIAHDFNNILTVVIGNLDILGRKMKGSDVEPKVLRYVDAAVVGAKNAADLTRRLLAFARKQPLAPDSIKLCALLDGVMEMLDRTIGETVEIAASVEEGTWPVWADANQLDNVLVNLALNARDAMPGGGKLTITARNVNIPKAASMAHDGLFGAYVAIAVEDNGTGMSPETLEKAFEPFFTTKGVGKGSGLGLSQVYGFAKQSNGHVVIDSAVGAGTTVTLYLPRAIRIEPPVEGPNGALHRGAGQTILVVDDNDEVRDYSVSALEDLGYRVFAAADASDAMYIIREHKIDMLIADVGLPGVDGPTLARKMLELQPRTPVLYMSGYAKSVMVDQGKLSPDDDIILKPFTFGSISEKIDIKLSAQVEPA